MAIVPPSGVISFFQKVAGEVLYYAAYEEGYDKGGSYGGFEACYGPDGDCDEYGAEAVYGEPGAGEESAVYESVVLAVFEGDFYAPAYYGEGEELEEEVYVVFHGGSFSFEKAQQFA